MIKKYYYIAKNILSPINRSLSGKGVIESLKIIKKEFPKIKIKKIKSGTIVFDWKIPSEWNVSDAYVIDKNGKKVIDIKKNNLHLLGYSTPQNKIISKKDLIKNLHFIKKQPDAIPYVTSYYKKRWGFCISYNQFKEFNKKYSLNDKFKVVINSNLNTKGNLNYGELVLKGNSSREILVSTYICHPYMANDNLSGIIVTMGLINHFSKLKIDKTIRFIFVPETIGSIFYINKNFNHLKKNVFCGYNLSCIGDEGKHSCLLSKYKNSPSDEAIIQAYKNLKIKKYKIYPFLKRGSDERQYNSPGVDLGISSIFKSKYAEYKEYHTSKDDFKLVTLKGIKDGYKVALKSLQILQKNIYPKYKILCEPQLGKRGLFPTLSMKRNSENFLNYTNFLQYADGSISLEKISKLINLEYKLTKKIYLKLKNMKIVF